MRDSFQVKVNPEILNWAVNTSGWEKQEVATRLRVSEKKIDDWLAGEAKPTIKQLEKFSTVVKRPLAIFFVENVPVEKPLPKDYRKKPEKRGQFDRKTLLAIRKARNLQTTSRELSSNMEAELKADFPKGDLSDNPKQIAQAYRDKLNFNINLLSEAKTPNQVFNYLRDTLEEKNVFVFQISMPLNDARGFCLLDDYPNVIVVNSKDFIKARIFTLAHELGHVALGESEISNPQEYLGDYEPTNKVEKWCNDFASEFLLSEKEARQLFRENRQTLTDSNMLNKISNKYKLSKAMMLYNMYKFDFISKQKYKQTLDRYNEQVKREIKKSERKKRGFGLSSEKRCFSEKGEKFISLVVDNIERGNITRYDALNYLSVKSKNLDKVISRLKK